MKFNLFTLLNSNNYHTFNRKLAHEIGLYATIMLSEIIDKFCYFEEKGMLEDGWFYLTIEEVFQRTTLAKDAQRGAIQILKELGFIDCKQKGMPSKRYFRVFKEKFTESENSDIKKEETRKQDSDNSDIKKSELSQPAPYYKNPKEDPYKNPPPPSSKPETENLSPATKEEEEELQKRFKERPKNAPKIKSFKRWKETVLAELRKEGTKLDMNLYLEQQRLERIKKHKWEAEFFDNSSLKGFLIRSREYHLEISKKGRLTPISYDCSDEVWYDSVPWDISDFKGN